MGRFETRRAGGAGLLMALAAALPLAGQAHGTVELPLSVEAAGRLVVPVRTGDGRTLQFAVSTMVPTSMVAASLANGDAAGLGLTLEGAGPLTDVQAIADEALTAGGHRVDGFLALSALGDVDVLLDAPRGRMVLRPVGRAVEWPGVALSDPVRIRIYHGVALRLEASMGGRDFGATLDLAATRNTANAGVAAGAGIASGTPAAVSLGGTLRRLAFEVGDTPILQRWDPEGAGFVAFGAPLAADCALSLSYVHQELRTCAS